MGKSRGRNGHLNYYERAEVVTKVKQSDSKEMSAHEISESVARVADSKWSVGSWSVSISA